MDISSSTAGDDSSPARKHRLSMTASPTRSAKVSRYEAEQSLVNITAPGEDGVSLQGVASSGGQESASPTPWVEGDRDRFLRQGLKGIPDSNTPSPSRSSPSSLNDAHPTLSIPQWPLSPAPTPSPKLRSSPDTPLSPVITTSAAPPGSFVPPSNEAAQGEKSDWLGRVDYSKIPRDEWCIWRRCCTCHVVYFAGGEHEEKCPCGHGRCVGCAWAADVGYAPFY